LLLFLSNPASLPFLYVLVLLAAIKILPWRMRLSFSSSHCRFWCATLQSSKFDLLRFYLQFSYLDHTRVLFS
jgi:hypothetical protein